MVNPIERRLTSYRLGLWFILGVTLAVAVVFLAGDLPFAEGRFAYGWTTLWLLSLIGCIPIGVVILIGPVWRTLPLTRRRWIAIGYLTLGFLDLLTLAAGMLLTFGASGPGLWLLSLVYALGIGLAIQATQPAKRKAGEEMFP